MVRDHDLPDHFLQLEDLLHAGFDAPREIQLATEVHGEKRVGLPHMEKGKAAVGRLEQRSDVALRGLGDVDHRKRDMRGAEALDAALNDVVARCDHVH